MKKYLLPGALALAILFCTLVTNAQVILTQNFDAPTPPALPTGWTQNSSSSPGWQTGSFAPGVYAGGAPAPPTYSSQVIYVTDYGGTINNLNDTLKSPVFSLAGMTAPWLNFKSYFFHWNGERGQILGSSNGGATWSVIDTLTDSAWTGSFYNQHVSLSSLGTGTNNKIAFRYTDAGNTAMYAYLDSVVVVNLIDRTAGLTAIDYNSITNGISANGETVSCTIENRGIPITSLTLYYRINGGALVVQNFPGLSMGAYAKQSFSFVTPISGAVAGTSNSIRIGILAVNGSSNTEPVDSAWTSTFTCASATTQRKGLIEQFSSSSSVPSKIFCDNYDPLCVPLHPDSAGSNFSLIRYQIPVDSSYNADANNRATFYNFSAYPVRYVNGSVSKLTWSNPFTATEVTNFTNEITNAATRRAFADISATYTVDTVAHKLNVIVNVTPHFTKTGNYHIYTAVLDSYYQNSTSISGQLKYYHVMRKMLPTASGRSITSFTDGVTQTYYDTAVAFTNGNWMAGPGSYPHSGSNTFWRNPLLNSEIVVFIQEDANKSVMQSAVIKPTPACMPAVASAISGSSAVCAGSTLTLTTAAPGGSWSSSSLSTATVGTSGIVAGIAAGSVTISYTTTGYCGGTATTTYSITVDAAPSTATIVGSTSLCTGSTVILGSSIVGGTWVSSSPSVATISSAGSVTALTVGTTTISYTVSNSCGVATVTTVITVSTPPVAGTISGGSSLCEGATLPLSSSSSGGSWSSSSSAIASVDGSGTVTGMAGGSATITYTVTNSCGVATATQAVTVSPLPDAGSITGPGVVCVSQTTTLYETVTGGIWSMSGTNAAVSSTGIVTGIAAGTDSVVYTTSNSCGNKAAKKMITINDCSAGISAVISAGEIQVYPNPVQCTVAIISTEAIRNVAITNAVGQRVYSAVYDAKSVKIDMATMPAGIYMLQINDVNIYKLVKQ